MLTEVKGASRGTHAPAKEAARCINEWVAESAVCCACARPMASQNHQGPSTSLRNELENFTPPAAKYTAVKWSEMYRVRLEVTHINA